MILRCPDCGSKKLKKYDQYGEDDEFECQKCWLMFYKDEVKPEILFKKKPKIIGLIHETNFISKLIRKWL